MGDCDSGVLPLSLGGSSQGTRSTVLWIYHTATLAERERGTRELCDGELIGGEESREEVTCVHSHRAGRPIRLIQADVLIQDLKRIFVTVAALSTLARTPNIYTMWAAISHPN
jgi:hypothetical protein